MYLCTRKREQESFRKAKWRFRLAARTHASHAWNTGSIPVGATKRLNFGWVFFLYSLIIFKAPRKQHACLAHKHLPAHHKVHLISTIVRCFSFARQRSEESGENTCKLGIFRVTLFLQWYSCRLTSGNVTHLIPDY